MVPSEGTIPQGEYGGGTVMLWDCGTWESEGNAADDYQKGKLVFRLNGKRLKGHWALIRMGGKAGAGGKNWLLKKLEDDEARPDDNNILNTNTISVVSNRTMDEIADNVKAPSKSRRSSKSSANSAIGPEAATRSTRRSLDPSSLPGAKQSAMPNELSPELPAPGRTTPARCELAVRTEARWLSDDLLCERREGIAPDTERKRLDSSLSNHRDCYRKAGAR